ncbi:MAG: hypothetical protein IPH35_03880 [Rhodoferax sp.]|nr:hypothetical protein [Rhodoferax sp.]
MRYVLRRNPVRQSELAASHQSKFERLQALLDKSNQYLDEHKRAKTNLALARIEKKCKELGLQAWVSVTLNERILSLKEDAQAKSKHTQLDGCYVIKTDVKAKKASKEVARALQGSGTWSGRFAPPRLCWKCVRYTCGWLRTHADMPW